MSGTTEHRSFLHKMKVCNFGYFGPEGAEIALDQIVVLVGTNNSGKSTVLRAYEAARDNETISPDEVFSKDPEKHPGFVKLPPTVELWVHIPEGAENIDPKWKEHQDGMLLVRSKWTWPVEGGKPTRTTWNPQANEYAGAEDGRAAGLDNVFKSRLPKPFRIGSLKDPAEEHRKLLDLVLEPIKTKLTNLMKDKTSSLHAKVRELQKVAENPVAEFRDDLDKVQKRVNTSYRQVFSSAEIRLSVSLGELTVDPGAALVKSSYIGVVESHGETRWSQQGTGSQRALFWSMLEVRSELMRIEQEKKAGEKELREKRKALQTLEGKELNLESAIQKNEAAKAKLTDEIEALEANRGAAGAAVPAPFLPGYMLLIDEPETALHPSAVRAAKEHLYSLAAEAGWQVMLATNHPAFVDPLKDHTTIVRLHRPEMNAAPDIYRTDTAGFDKPEKDVLKALLAFDQSVTEMFFSRRVIIIEGDTEFAAFTGAMEADSVSFPLEDRPLLLRARGKWTIPLLLRILHHFRVLCAVLHDADAPRTSSGAKKNPAYTANEEITKAVAAARTEGVHIIHRCSVPEFEREHGMELPSKDKPFEAWKATRDDATIQKSVRSVLDQLCEAPMANAREHADDGRHYEAKLKPWVEANANDDPAFVFDETGDAGKSTTTGMGKTASPR